MFTQTRKNRDQCYAQLRSLSGPRPSASIPRHRFGIQCRLDRRSRLRPSQVGVVACPIAQPMTNVTLMTGRGARSWEQRPSKFEQGGALYERLGFFPVSEGERFPKCNGAALGPL